MDNQEVYIYDLIIKHLSGEASTAEKAELDVWLSESDANKSYYEEVKVIWDNSGQGHHDDEFNVDDAWNNFSSLLDDKKDDNNVIDINSVKKEEVPSSHSKGFMYFFTRVAAVLVIGLASWYFYNSTTSINENTVANVDIPKPELKPELITKVNDEIGYSDTLTDGTVVHLNSETTFKFYERFEGEIREVFLEGEAYFDVAENPEVPFIINTKNAYVKVLGTSFNLKAIDGKTITVAVDTGKVMVSNKEDFKFGNKCENVITKGQIGVYSTSENVIVITESTDMNHLSWKSGELEFADVSLKKAIPLFESIYNINIKVIDEEIYDFPLTGRYKKEQASSEVMEIISWSFIDLEISSDDGVNYIFNKKK